MSNDHGHDDDSGGDVHDHEHTESGWIPLAISGITIAIGLIIRFTQGPTQLSELLLLTTMVLSLKN